MNGTASISELLRMRPLNSLTLSSARTRILLMKSRISLTSLEMEAAPFMILTNSVEDLSRRRKNFSPPLRRLRVPLNKKRTRFSALSLSLAKCAKAEALRIKKKLEGDINELEIGLDHANKANSE